MDSNTSKIFEQFAYDLGKVQGALARDDLKKMLLALGCSTTDLELLKVAIDRISPVFYVDMSPKD